MQGRGGGGEEGEGRGGGKGREGKEGRGGGGERRERHSPVVHNEVDRLINTLKRLDCGRLAVFHTTIEPLGK